MRSLQYSTQFKKDYKSLTSDNQQLVDDSLVILAEQGTLPYSPYLTHKLTNNYKNHYEAHVKPDLLVIWFELDGVQPKVSSCW